MSEVKKQQPKGAQQAAPSTESLEKKLRRLEKLLGVPEGESTETAKAAKTIDERIQRLEEAVGAATTVLEISDQLRNALVAGLQNDLEAKLVSSPLFRGGRWLLGLSITLGIVLWLGGAWYAGTQIKSVRQSADAAAARMEEVVDRVKHRADEVIQEKVLGEVSARVKRVAKVADEATVSIVKKRQAAEKILNAITLEDVTRINEALTNEIRRTIDLKVERERQLAELEQLDRLLDVPARTARVVWVLIIVSGLALLLSLVSLLWRRRS